MDAEADDLGQLVRECESAMFFATRATLLNLSQKTRKAKDSIRKKA